MDIPALSPHGPGARTGALASQSDFQTFLTMLTAQMRNQDPLNPMSASDYAAQLATFAGVEQQTYTNQLLSAMLSQSGLADLADWVGMEARISGGVWFDGSPITLTPDPAPGADAVTLIVRDRSGAIVDSRALDPTAQQAIWDGRDSSGNPLAAGQYSFEIDMHRNGDLLDTRPVAAYVPVLEARLQDGMTQLVLPGGVWIDSSAVTGLRRPVG